MWVSGSLISSSTCRSSSVSAPSIWRSIFLPSSCARSRTSRGSLAHALPIGCMRVFMTPSCNSDVTWLRRWSGAANSLSFWLRRIWRSWLRVSTSSETMVIRFSSRSTLTRMVWAATADSLLPASRVSSAVKPALAAGAGAAAGGAATGACSWTTSSLAAIVAGTSGTLATGAAGTEAAGGGGGAAAAGSRAAGTGSKTKSGSGSTDAGVAATGAGAAATGAGAAGAAAGTSRPSAMAFNREIRPLSSPGGSASVASSTERISLMVSSDSRMADTAWGDTCNSPSRNLPSTFSDA